MKLSTEQCSLLFCISLKSPSRNYISVGPKTLFITVILRPPSNTNFSQSKLNIKNLSEGSLDELEFSHKMEK